MIGTEGFALMLTGMGTVFSFLVILWASVSLMGVIVGKLNEIWPAEVQAAPATVNKTSSDVEVALAIAAAKLKR
ncbi:OadG family protein [bacterium]|nr:OadG family protein [bacterium]